MKLQSLIHNVLPEFPDSLPNNEVDILKEIPVETIYFALKTADEETALWLYENARVEQIQGLMDLDCWNGDQFKPEQYTKHFRLLAMASPQRIWELSKWVDPEIIVRGLMDMATIIDFDPQEPPDVDENSLILSPDSKYALILKTTDSNLKEAIFQWMNKISAVDIDLMRRHLESCKWEQLSDLEEYAYQMKKGRLEDIGFVERIDAIQLYSKGINAPKLKQQMLANPLPHNSKSGTALIDTPITTDLLPEKMQQPLFSGGYLSETISGLENDTLKRNIYQELIRTINAMLVADDVLGSEIEVVGASTRRARLYIDLGLAYISDTDLPRSRELLPVHRIFDIYRLGWLLVQDLIKAAENIKSNFNPALFGEEDKKLLSELNGRHPKLSNISLQNLDIEEEDFVHLSGVTKIGERIAKLALLGVYFTKDLAPSLQADKDPLDTGESAYSRLLSGIFKQASGSEFSISPINDQEWKKLSAGFDASKAKTMITLLAERAPEESKELFLSSMFKELELLEELVKHNKASISNSKFVTCIRIEL